MPAASYMTWGTNSASVQIGETITVPYTNDLGLSPNDAGVTRAFNGLATSTVSSEAVSITGVSAGTVTVATDTDVGNGVITANNFTLTVVASADDESYLNKRGLTHFWENIDNIKQDKLTAVTAEDIADVSTIDVSALLARIYPVGSIYMSATISTASLVNATLGGTWVSWGAGRVPVGVNSSDSDFNTVEKAGGEKTHILTTNEMPSHTHQTINYAGGYTGGSQSGYRTVLSGTSTSTTYDAVKAAGGGAAHNNLQPYITCYMYKRVA